MTCLVGVVDSLLNGSGLDSCQETALFLNGEEQLPAFLGDGHSQLFHEVAAAADIHDLVKVALLLEQQLLVACYTLCEIRRNLVGSVKRSNHHRVNACESGTHGLGLRAEHIHIAVEHRLVVGRGSCVDAHLAGALALGVILLNNLSPEHTGCAELGNLHEVVAADAHVELDFLGGEVNGNAGLHHLVEVFLTPGEGVAQLLIDVGTAVAEQVAVNHHATQVGEVLQLLYQLRHVGQQHSGVLALHQHTLDGVETDAADNLGLVVALLLVVGHNQISQLQHVTLAGAEAHLHAVAADAAQQRLDELCVQVFSVETEAERVNTLVQDVESLCVGFLRVCDNDVLANIPDIVVFFVAADEGKLAREGVHCGQLVHVFLQIKRLHGESLRGSPHHFLLVVSALEVNLNLVTPFLTCRGGEVREELFFIFCHN